ncbi:MAG: hypothetical protein ACREJO_10155 [Phycisphaerales bacterium]
MRLAAAAAMALGARCAWAVAAPPGVLPAPVPVPVAVSAAGAPLVTVPLRSSNAVVTGELVDVSSGGLRVRLPGPRTVWYSWDLVRADGEPAFKPYTELSESALRAKLRAERGDLAMAERELGHTVELLGDPWPTPGPTGALCAEGLVRCRLARGWRIGATWSWLAWIATRSETASWVGGGMRGDQAVDIATGLCPQLPPIYSARMDGDAIRASTDSPEWAKLRGSPGLTGELAEYYAAAMAFEASKSASEGAALAGKTPTTQGAQLVWEIVMSRVGDPDTRKAARDKLARRVDSIDGLASTVRAGPESPDAVLPAMSDTPREALNTRWVEAWAHAAIGRSLLMEAELGQRRMGVLELLHIPARFGDIMPGLAALCLAEAAGELETMGDAGAAARLRADLDSRFLNTSGAAESEKPTPKPPAKKTTNEKRNR